MLAEIQVSPRPYGNDESEYAHVHPAIAAIRDSGLHYEVHGLGTVVEGTPDEIWALLRRVHEAPLGAGATQTASIIKVHQHGALPGDAGAAGDGRDAAATAGDPTPTMDRLTRDWRP